MVFHPGELEDRSLVSLEAQPVQAVEDGLDGGLGGALAVGVLDTQQELAAAAFRIQPVEKCGAGAAYM